MMRVWCATIYSSKVVSNNNNNRDQDSIRFVADSG